MGFGWQIFLDGESDKGDIERRAFAEFLFEEGAIGEKIVEKNCKKTFKEDFEKGVNETIEDSFGEVIKKTFKKIFKETCHKTFYENVKKTSLGPIRRSGQEFQYDAVYRIC